MMREARRQFYLIFRIKAHIHKAKRKLQEEIKNLAINLEARIADKFVKLLEDNQSKNEQINAQTRELYKRLYE